MTFYKCDCGVAHGNVHTPWQENQCHRCDFYPPVFVRGIKVIVGERGGSHWVYLVGKNNEKTFLVCYCFLPSVEDIESAVDFWLASLTASVSKEGSQVNYSSYLEPTPEEAAAGITGWIVREPVNIDEVILSRKAVQSSVATSQATGGFINTTGGSGPIFPYGDLPEVGMIQESELEPQACTCDTFLLMQRGCQCGHFAREQGLKK